MTIQTINIGTTPNDGTGDPARTAFTKMNSNFTQSDNAASKLVATNAQVLAGTPDVLPDAEQVRSVIAQDVPSATTETPGRVEKATNAEALAGTADKFPDAAGVHAAFNQFGLGVSVVPPLVSDLNSAMTVGVYRANNTTLNQPNGSNYGSVFVKAFQVDTKNIVQEYTSTGNNNSSRFFYRAFNVSTNTWIDWREIYHTGNTTVDANGFIKQASPIISLYSDRAESNGSDELADVNFERVSTGHYIIRNVPLLSRDGWYIETPKDRNNNIYFTIDYDESIEGELTIRTYEPDYSTGRATNGNPVDIIEGRFVSLRFEAAGTETQPEGA